MSPSFHFDPLSSSVVFFFSAKDGVARGVSQSVETQESKRPPMCSILNFPDLQRRLRRNDPGLQGVVTVTESFANGSPVAGWPPERKYF
jgi:hypothetical protein